VALEEPDALTEFSSANAPRTTGVILGLLPAVFLAVLLLGNENSVGWLGAHPLETPRLPYDQSLLQPKKRDWIRNHPPQGVAVGLYSMDPRFDYQQHLEEVAATGARWVELIVNYYQERHDSSSVAINDRRTATPKRIRTTIQQAHQLGLKVHLMPILLIREPRAQDWRGTITPIEPTRWHRSYREWMREVAEVAEENSVEALCVGSELNSRQGERSEWLETIARVREVYHGAVTYSANWDSYETVSFLDALDAIGMTTYHPLVSGTNYDPTLDQLVQAWLPLEAKLSRWASEIDLPMLFTEVGYPSIDGAAMRPWDYTAQGPPDELEQHDCLRAFEAVWSESEVLTGVFFFIGWGEGGPLDRGYTVRGKKGCEVIERWFRTTLQSGAAENSSAPAQTDD